jgi:glycosyltransferase involved in cell wall biosynthesis
MTVAAITDGVARDREIVLDISRLSTRMSRATPNGIDRVDASFAAHFLAGARNHKALLFTPVGPRPVRGAAASRILDAVHHRWREAQRPESDAAFLHLRARLEEMRRAPADGAPPRASERRSLPLGMALRVGAGAAGLHIAAWRAFDRIRINAIYLNVSQFPVWIPRYFRWLRDRPDIRPVFMIHDFLPIDHPEFFDPGSFRRHTKRLALVAQLAAGVLVSSEAAADALRVQFGRTGRRTIPILVQPLPVSPIFAAPREIDETLAAQPYFLVCGTIEPRKNHLLLFNVWRALARLMGPATPTLIVAGCRGWENENAIDMLERCPAMRAHVIEAPGLSTPSLKRLMDNARAVLMPSFAEGYGLPVAEALAAGAPVIASDTPSLHAMGGSEVACLDPLDGLGWLAAIRRLAEAPAIRVRDHTEQTTQAVSQEVYFRRIETFLGGL